MNKLKLTKLQEEILRVLFIKTNLKLNQNNLANLLDVSQPAIMKALPYLEEKELILMKQDPVSKRWSIELNGSNQYVFQLKRVDNLKQIYESGLFNFLETEFAGSTIILFGSYSFGEDTINSDIDLAIVGRKQKEVNLKKFEKILERKININFYESFKKIHQHLKENLCNGIILLGGIEL